jgi:predicted phosphate transport protein (TIGR00153 family)
MFRILPREAKFFDLFVDMARNIERASEQLVELLRIYDNVPERVLAIKNCEHLGDQMTHGLFTRLNKTFITPIDREDIHELASKMDDVLDMIDAAASRMVIYKIEKPTEDSVRLAELIHSSTKVLVRALAVLEKHDHIMDHCIEINRLEKEGDRVSRIAIARLFDDGKDPFYVIKWKEIYEVLEKAIDKCEDVANVIEGVVVKNA